MPNSSPVLPPPVSTFKKTKLLIYAVVLVIVLLVLWQGAAWLGSPEVLEQQTFNQVFQTESLTKLQAGVSSWQKFWQDPRFTDLKSVNELTSAMAGNSTPFNKPDNTVPKH